MHRPVLILRGPGVEDHTVFCFSLLAARIYKSRNIDISNGRLEISGYLPLLSLTSHESLDLTPRTLNQLIYPVRATVLVSVLERTAIPYASTDVHRDGRPLLIPHPNW